MTHLVPMRLKRPRQTEAVVQQPSMLQYDGEARARLEDFSRFFGSVAAEAQETKAQLLDSKDKLTTLLNRVSEQDGVIQEQEARLDEQDKRFRQITEYVAKCKGKVIEKGEAINALEQRVQTFQRLVADQQKEIKDQKSQVVKLEQIRDMGRTKQMEFQSERNALEDRLKTQSDFVHAAQEQFTDCITLDQNANCILLTSGQHTNLEGIIKIWMHNENFNGDVWFPFQCPVTKTTTMPVRDLSTVDFTARVGACIGLSSVPVFHFRYKATPMNSEDHSAWEMYKLSEQLMIFSKLLFTYHRRDSDDANAMVSVKNSSHVITINCKRQLRPPTQNEDADFDYWEYEFILALIVISPGGFARQHFIEFCGVDIFHGDCRFTSRHLIQ